MPASQWCRAARRPGTATTAATFAASCPEPRALSTPAASSGRNRWSAAMAIRSRRPESSPSCQLPTGSRPLCSGDATGIPAARHRSSRSRSALLLRSSSPTGCPSATSLGAMAATRSSNAGSRWVGGLPLPALRRAANRLSHPAGPSGDASSAGSPLAAAVRAPVAPEPVRMVSHTGSGQESGNMDSSWPRSAGTSAQIGPSECWYAVQNASGARSTAGAPNRSASTSPSPVTWSTPAALARRRRSVCMPA